MLVKAADNQLRVDNSNVKYYFNNSTSYVKILAVSLVFFLLGMGNNLGQTFTTIGTSNGNNTNNSYEGFALTPPFKRLKYQLVKKLRLSVRAAR